MQASERARAHPRVVDAMIALDSTEEGTCRSTKANRLSCATNERPSCTHAARLSRAFAVCRGSRIRPSTFGQNPVNCSENERDHSRAMRPCFGRSSVHIDHADGNRSHRFESDQIGVMAPDRAVAPTSKNTNAPALLSWRCGCLLTGAIIGLVYRGVPSAECERCAQWIPDTIEPGTRIVGGVLGPDTIHREAGNRR